MRGFTLIEAMVVVAVLGVILGIAVTSYQSQVMRTRRAEGTTALMNMAQTLERCFTRFSSYNDAGCTTGMPFSTENGLYTISAASINASTYSLAATPINGQAGDTDCGVLRLAHTGQRGSLNQPTTDANNCW